MKKHVFLSYCREDAGGVAELREQLLLAGESVWWDRDILGGQDWKLEIRKAMRDAYAVVVCFSANSQSRTTSGIYPELLDAIIAYREYAPGSVFIIPIRLSPCEIPLIDIDGVRTLDRLNYIDLFPPDAQNSGLRQLFAAIRGVPHHP